MRGLVLFGYYPDLPAWFRKQGSQPTFAYGHAMAGLNGDIPADALPPFFREDKLELGPITGCTQTSAAMVAAWATGNRSIAQPVTREALQSAMGTQKSGATPKQLQAGVAKVLGLDTLLGSTWPLILDALGPTAWVADPLGYRWTRIATRDLQPFCAGHTRIISAYQTVIFTRTESPDTATEDRVTFAQLYPNRNPARIVHIAAGSLSVYDDLQAGTQPVAKVVASPTQGISDTLAQVWKPGAALDQPGIWWVHFTGNPAKTWLAGKWVRLGEIQDQGGRLDDDAPSTVGGFTQTDIDNAKVTATQAGAHTAALAIADYATKTFPG